MKPLSQLCHPRPSVFDPKKRDTVLDLNDLVSNRIDPGEFFAENFVTEGMKVLLHQGFLRLEGKSDQGIFLLRQAMGGGKTHSLLALGLLAKHPELRASILHGIHTPEDSLGPVTVVAFSGRESDAPLGIWGAIAEQLGAKEHFAAHYSPLAAPGQTAWQTLLKGRTVLILLDELPPYFENAHSISVGSSNLATVTETALSNLLVAINREGCERVCLVVTDLAGSYQAGSGQVAAVLTNLQNETHRSAMSLEPVSMGTDELYHILRTRLFDNWSSSATSAQPVPDSEIDSVAQGFASAIKAARQMDITSESPEQFAARVVASYPFHPSIRDLYARFRENQGFQQTRGLIRLMRIVTSRLWTTQAADTKYLISAHDVDFNDPETLSEITQINSALTNAIAHDIASNGSAVAEVMDANLGASDTQDAARLLLMASLANVPNSVVGLSIPELVAYLCAPGRDLSKLKGDVLERFATAAWYLHSSRDNKLYFKNVQNLNAKLEGYVKSYNKVQAVKELRVRLEEIFKPVNSWCYQKVLVLPPLDEIDLEQDKVTLVVTEPQPGSGLRDELRQFWEGATYRNRIAFLTGAKDTYETLIDAGKRMRAVGQIVAELKAERTADSDPQMVQAMELETKVQLQFYSAVRETFTQLWYPTRISTEDQLLKADLPMKFDSNKYEGEKQVLDLLRERKKFEEDIAGETFRLKCEQRLFGGAQSILWNEIKKRAAMNPQWQWHRADALDALKTNCVHQAIWREDGGFVDKGPFPPPATDLTIQEKGRNEETGEVVLRVMPLNGDTIYYDVGADATTASARLEGNEITTKALRLSFLAADSTGKHALGKPKAWTNRITIKYKFYQSGNDQMLELRAAPQATIHYTTNGANPKVGSATYAGDFVVPKGAIKVLAYGVSDGVESVVEEIKVPDPKIDKEVRIDPEKPADWSRKHQYSSTQESYAFLARLKKYKAGAVGLEVTISGTGSDKGWIQLNTSENQAVNAELVEKCLEALRLVQTSGQVQLIAGALHFAQGFELQAWVEDAKLTLEPVEVRQ